MLSEEKLEQLKDISQTSIDNVVREYCQHVFLSFLYQQDGSEKLLFKGGTALRILFKSPRFSEDLDFTGQKLTATMVEVLFMDTLEKVERTGMKVELIEGKPTTGGYIGIANFTVHKITIDIQIQVSFRVGKPVAGLHNSTENEYIPLYTIVSLPREMIIQGKLDALFNRHKPRDFYDYFFLLHGNYPLVKEKDVLQKVLGLLKHERTDFRRELREFLPKSQAMLLRDFPGILEQKIRSFLG